jgi:hypothetical protein
MQDFLHFDVGRSTFAFPIRSNYPHVEIHMLAEATMPLPGLFQVRHLTKLREACELPRVH